MIHCGVVGISLRSILHASGLLRFTSATLIVNGISSALVHATSGQEFSHIDGQSLVAVVCMIFCLLFRELYFVCVTLLKIWLAKGEAAQYPHHQKVATRLITSTSGKGGWQRASLFYILPASLMWWAVGYRPNDVGFPTFTVLMVALSLTCLQEAPHGVVDRALSCKDSGDTGAEVAASQRLVTQLRLSVEEDVAILRPVRGHPAILRELVKDSHRSATSVNHSNELITMY